MTLKPIAQLKIPNSHEIVAVNFDCHRCSLEFATKIQHRSSLQVECDGTVYAADIYGNIYSWTSPDWIAKVLPRPSSIKFQHDTILHMELVSRFSKPTIAKPHMLIQWRSGNLTFEDTDQCWQTNRWTFCKFSLLDDDRFGTVVAVVSPNFADPIAIDLIDIQRNRYLLKKWSIANEEDQNSQSPFHLGKHGMITALKIIPLDAEKIQLLIGTEGGFLICVSIIINKATDHQQITLPNAAIDRYFLITVFSDGNAILGLEIFGKPHSFGVVCSGSANYCVLLRSSNDSTYLGEVLQVDQTVKLPIEGVHEVKCSPVNYNHLYVASWKDR